jgi:hypothetical protein
MLLGILHPMLTPGALGGLQKCRQRRVYAVFKVSVNRTVQELDSSEYGGFRKNFRKLFDTQSRT